MIKSNAKLFTSIVFIFIYLAILLFIANLFNL